MVPNFSFNNQLLIIFVLVQAWYSFTIIQLFEVSTTYFTKFKREKPTLNRASVIAFLLVK